MIQVRVANKSMPQPGSPEAAQMTANERKAVLAWAQSADAQAHAMDLAVLLKEDRNKARSEFIARCTGCHGASGISISPEFPNLAQHDSVYIENRLHEFMKEGAQGFMPAQLHGILTEFGLQDSGADNADVKDLFAAAAKHFSSAVPPKRVEEFEALRKKFDQATAVEYEKGKKLFTDNNCAGCHLANEGHPIEGAPMIMCQRQNYLLKRLPEEKASTIEGNPMPSILESLTETDLQALAVYLSHTDASEVPAQQ